MPRAPAQKSRIDSSAGSAADIVVVGAGPAGMAAAITAAQAGLRVVVLEATGGSHNRPGETLHPGVEPLFEQLGVVEAVRAASFLRHSGIHVVWNGPARFVSYGGDADGPWRGFQAWRSTLDAILQAHAVRLGVRLHRHARVTGLLCAADRIVGVLAGGRPVCGRWLVDAAGGGHWAARRAGLPIARLSPRLIASHGYVRRAGGETPWFEADAEGWTWRAEVRPGLYQWTRLWFDSFRARDWIASQSQPKGRGADVTWRWVPDSAGPGYFLAGDAAAVLDPSSSHGVLRALLSGMLAGHSIVRIANGLSSESDACLVYRDSLRRWIEHDVRELKNLYGGLLNPPSWLPCVPDPPWSQDPESIQSHPFE
jgi:flavin-dependent dehydrogenase